MLLDLPRLNRAVGEALSGKLSGKQNRIWLLPVTVPRSSQRLTTWLANPGKEDAKISVDCPDP